MGFWLRGIEYLNCSLSIKRKKRAAEASLHRIVGTGNLLVTPTYTESVSGHRAIVARHMNPHLRALLKRQRPHPRWASEKVKMKSAPFVVAYLVRQDFPRQRLNLTVD